MVKCGAEFLPSPLASTAEFALTAEPSFTHKGHMTAVAVALEMEHAVAFLGTTNGEVMIQPFLFLFLVRKLLFSLPEGLNYSLRLHLL